MSTTLLQSLRHAISADIIDRAASNVNESPANTTKAVSAALPAVLGGLVNRSGDPKVLSTVVESLRVTGGNSDALLSPAAMLDGLKGAGTAAGDMGDSLLSTIFGGDLASVSDAIGSFAGIRASSARSLLGLVAPALLGVIGDRVRTENLDAHGLSRLLEDQKGEVTAALPTGLAGIAGLSNLPEATENPARDLDNDARRRTAEVGPTELVPVERRSLNWMWPLLGVAAIAAIWFFARGGGREMADDTSTLAGETAVELDSAGERVAGAAGSSVDPVDASGRALDASGGAIDPTSGWVGRTLPGGVELKAPPNGIENRLVDFIENDDLTVNDTAWFNFDRLTFQTGSATLTAASQDQLRNVAEILTAYPDVRVKIGGYTDNTGSAAANLALSAERAANVTHELQVLGIPPTRLESEGYGASHPVADNSTEEGRARNRRIALLVLAK